MQSITPELAAILKAKWQAGADGFRARLEMDAVSGPSAYDAAVVASAPISYWRLAESSGTVAVDEMGLHDGEYVGGPTLGVPGLLGGDADTAVGLTTGGDYVDLGSDPDYDLYPVSIALWFRASSPGSGYRYLFGREEHWAILLKDGKLGSFSWSLAYGDKAFDIDVADGEAHMAVAVFNSNQLSLYLDGELIFDHGSYFVGLPFIHPLFAGHAESDAGADLNGTVGKLAIWDRELTPEEVATLYTLGVTSTTSYRVIRAAPSTSLATDADRCDLDLDNSDGAIALDGIPVNTPVRVFAWYGDIANEIQIFDGLIDRVRHTRHPHIVTISARDWMKKLIVQKIGLIASQDVIETDAYVRDATNAVYLGMEVSDIVTDLLDRAGFPGGAKRVIEPTSVTVDEFRGADDEPYAGAISRLGDLVSYLSFTDEHGVYHFEPNDIGDARDPDYTYRTGEDIYVIESEADDDQLYTRVRVSGPMTASDTVDAWDEVWSATPLAHPVGVWYDPALPGFLRVLDSHTKRHYLIDQSDQSIVTSVYLGGSVTYPLGMSGDPADGDRYYVLNAPWAFTGGAVSGSRTGNKLMRFKTSDNSLQAVFDLPDGRWSDVKVGAGGDIWLTDYDTNQLWRFDYTTGNPIAGYDIVPGNPTGLAIDGDEITVFFENGNSYTVDESAPTVITRVIASAAQMWGGEWDTTTHTEMYVVGSGTLWKYTTSTTSSTSFEVQVEAINAALEAELAALTGYPEIRRLEVPLAAIVSIDDAQATADAMLARASRMGSSMDVAIIGNPALQKGDKIRIEDPVLGVAADYQAITYRSELSGDSGTYLGLLSMKPWIA